MIKKAWTMAEMTVAIMVIIVLSAATMTITKNLALNKYRILAYSALKTIASANNSITESEETQRTFYPEVASSHDAGSNANDWYCLNVANALSLKGDPNCTKNLNQDTANFGFSNGITFYGLSIAWVNAYGDLYYKDIMVDLDGSDGPNKIGMDRIPLRVYRGLNYENMNLDGIVYPADCDGDYLYNGSGTNVLSGKTHKYCSGKSNKIASTNSLISYQIHKVTQAGDTTRASVIAGGLTLPQADCLAFGNTGIYTANYCKDRYDLHEKCATEDTCRNCATLGICPNNGTVDTCKALINYISVTDNGTTTDETFPCFITMTKPTGGLGIIGSTIVAEMGL